MRGVEVLTVILSRVYVCGMQTSDNAHTHMTLDDDWRHAHTSDRPTGWRRTRLGHSSRVLLLFRSVNAIFNIVLFNTHPRTPSQDKTADRTITARASHFSCRCCLLPSGGAHALSSHTSMHWAASDSLTPSAWRRMM